MFFDLFVALLNPTLFNRKTIAFTMDRVYAISNKVTLK